MPKPIYLLCGVSGAGKSWVANQLQHKMTWVKQDEHYKDHPDALHKAAMSSVLPIITESPFGERVLREELERRGLEVIPYFIIESPHIVARRYMEREKKPLPKAAFTRSLTIKNRAEEWKAPYGTSLEVLGMLRDL